MKLNCSFQDIATVLDVKSSCRNEINSVVIDSRKPSRGSDVLFFALKGPNNDGHKYISELIGAGICHFVVNKDFSIDSFDANFIAVDDTTAALQKIEPHQCPQHQHQ